MLEAVEIIIVCRLERLGFFPMKCKMGRGYSVTCIKVNEPDICFTNSEVVMSQIHINAITLQLRA